MHPEGRVALEGKGPQRQPQQRLDGRLEEVVKAVGGGYCRLRMPLRLVLGVGGTAAGHRLGALVGGGGVPPPLPMHPCLRGHQKPSGNSEESSNPVEQSIVVIQHTPESLAVIWNPLGIGNSHPEACANCLHGGGETSRRDYFAMGYFAAGLFRMQS